MFKWPGVSALEQRIAALENDKSLLEMEKESLTNQKVASEQYYTNQLKSSQDYQKSVLKDLTEQIKKDNEVNAILKSWAKGSLSRVEMLTEVKKLDQAAWNGLLNSKESKIIELNQQFNSNEISIVEYKDGIKDLDITKWLTLATQEEREEYQLEDDYKNRKITDVEYEKAKATKAKEPFFAIVKFAIDKEKPENPFYMEWDWNEEFVNDLKKRNYRGVDDEEIIDAWFSHICTIIAAESDNVIVTNPEDVRRVKRIDNITEHY